MMVNIIKFFLGFFVVYPAFYKMRLSRFDLSFCLKADCFDGKRRKKFAIDDGVFQGVDE